MLLNMMNLIASRRLIAVELPDAGLPDPLGGKQITLPGAFQPKDLTKASGAAGGGQPLTDFLSVLLGFITIVAGMMFLMYFVFGALTWVSSGGDKGKVEKAKSQLTNAALGLIVVIVAQAVVGIVGGVLGLDILNPVSSLERLFTNVGP